jgi:hypothetical protein
VRRVSIQVDSGSGFTDIPGLLSEVSISVNSLQSLTISGIIELSPGDQLRVEYSNEQGVSNDLAAGISTNLSILFVSTRCI